VQAGGLTELRSGPHERRGAAYAGEGDAGLDWHGDDILGSSARLAKWPYVL
jgi:hypothetical protein